MAPLTERLKSSFMEEYNRIFLHSEWNVGIVGEPIHTFLERGARPDVRWLPPRRRGKYLADPFALVRDETIYILCEDFDHRSSKGFISCFEINADGSVTEDRAVISLPFHVSYPYLIEHKGEVYCIPETHEAREVALYRAEEFPHLWRKAAVLIEDLAALDSTVFRYDGRWWLTCTNNDEGPESRLLLWHASDLFGPWMPHTENPVKRDIHSSRPAGTPFIYRGDLYRPAQDSSQTYGGRTVLNRVVRLTTEEFSEEVAAVVDPYRDGPFPDGLHTISGAGDVTVLDGKRLVFVRSAFRQSLKEAIKDRWREGLTERWLPRLRSLVRGRKR